MTQAQAAQLGPNFPPGYEHLEDKPGSPELTPAQRQELEMMYPHLRQKREERERRERQARGEPEPEPEAEPEWITMPNGTRVKKVPTPRG